VQGTFEADSTKVSYQEDKLIKRLVGRVRAEYDGMLSRPDRAVYVESTGDAELAVAQVDPFGRLCASMRWKH